MRARAWFLRALGCLLVVTAAGLLFAPPAATQTDGQEGEAPERVTAVRGRLVAEIEGERRGVEGVQIVVSQDGDAVGEATTDEDGNWEVVLPRGGAYEVTLLEETLPEDVFLRDAERTTIEATVATGRRAGVIFALGDAAVAGRGTAGRLLNLTVQGIKLGAIIAMTAVGLSLIFGVTGLVNFAHGELVTFGAIVAWYLNASPIGPGIHLIPAALLAVVAGGLLGYGMDRGMFRPLRARQTGLIALIVVTIGLSLLFRHAFLMFFGAGRRPYVDYTVQRAVSFGPISITPRDLVIIVLSLVILVAVGLLLQRTQLGTAMRAVADSGDLAESSGIDVRRIILAVWVGGAALAALGGVLLASSERVSWDMGFTVLLLIFAAVILGGLGTAYGAMVGGLVIGVATTVSTFWLSVEFKFVVALVALVIMLLIRPQGILGQAERVG